eukprot:359094-Chlamydomonas_euryale.AAC.21
MRHINNHSDVSKQIPSEMAIGTASWIANKRGSVQTRGTTNREKACRGRARKLNNRSVHLR